MMPVSEAMSEASVAGVLRQVVDEVPAQWPYSGWLALLVPIWVVVEAYRVLYSFSSSVQLPAL